MNDNSLAAQWFEYFYLRGHRHSSLPIKVKKLNFLEKIE